MVPKAQYLLFTSVYELEASAIDALRENLSIPIHPIGPAIPYFGTKEQLSPVIADENQESDNVIKWLNAQAKSSVLYISQGSFLSVSSAQLDEIIAGVHESGVKYLWVAPGGDIDTSRFHRRNGDGGLVVPWCNQFKFLCHPSVGGFWSHCGWNSTKEAAFAGITFPIFWDQTTNSELIVGVKVQKGDGSLVMRDEICGLLRRFMDMKEMRKRAKMVRETCQNSLKKGLHLIEQSLLASVSLYL
ncbi:unnamed protein product [Cuscuta europaea]|uniref:Uncharacterized protein n=1 Tax=Cuscuta europaea TaxID=41803 RepID=A0A9P1A094_CUSEU|nr:unnamed protein product [Cuscuta europaea]